MTDALTTTNRSELAAGHRISELPILVIFPHSRCNCRCVMCDIWRIRQVREIAEHDLAPHLSSLRGLKVKWVVFSGGEPLMHSDLPSLTRLCRLAGVRITLLTAGLTLEADAAMVAASVDDVIVSLDGPADIHDSIRRVAGAYRRLYAGIGALRQLRPEIPIHGRCTIQEQNCRDLRATVRAAHDLGLNSLSFLAVDTSSTAFNRPNGWTQPRQSAVALDANDVDSLEAEIEALVSEFSADVNSGFVVEKPDKLRRIGTHFRARLGQLEFASPKCNAPWVSAVIESDGTVRPCFFQPAIGNIHEHSLAEIVNSDDAVNFRRRLDIPSDSICRTCVCSLFLKK
jgi:MoaA/NifB/PqqE/SkfB family radical SAM enzyme